MLCYAKSLQSCPTLCDPIDGLSGKDSDAGRDCGQEEKAMTEDEMAGWLTDSMDTIKASNWE